MFTKLNLKVLSAMKRYLLSTVLLFITAFFLKADNTEVSILTKSSHSIIDSKNVEIQTVYNTIQSKKSKGFLFEMNIEPMSPCPSSKGCICKKIYVYGPDHLLVFEKLFIGNENAFSNENIDSFQVGDYNFDNYPDFKLFNSYLKYQEVYVYDSSRKTYIREPLLSRMVNLVYDDKKLSAVGFIFDTIPHSRIGKFSHRNSYTNSYKLSGKNLTHVLISSTMFYNPWNGYNEKYDINIIDTSLFVYRNQKLISVSDFYGFADSQRFYGDYNFDGFEDFRQKNDTLFTWDVFIYNTINETYTLDTLLSKLQMFNYNSLAKQLEGSYTVKIDNLTKKTYYYYWSKTDSKMILYKTMTCKHKFYQSERIDCVVLTLIDGKWVETKILGAE